MPAVTFDATDPSSPSAAFPTVTTLRSFAPLSSIACGDNLGAVHDVDTASAATFWRPVCNRTPSHDVFRVYRSRGYHSGGSTPTQWSRGVAAKVAVLGVAQDRE